MHGDLAAILQVLHQQPETVLSERSKEALKKALKSGVVTDFNIGIICSSLRCTLCAKVIGDDWFFISQALWKDQYIKCEECEDNNIGYNPEKYEALPQEDKDFIELCRGKYAHGLTDEEHERLGRLIDQYHDWPDEEESKQIEDQFHRELREAEKIAYPKGRYKRAYWEELLKHRGVPLIPPQLR